MNFSASQTATDPQDGRAFHFSPASRAELPPQARQIANAGADRNRFNVPNFANDFKEHFRTGYLNAFFKNARPLTAMSFRFGSIFRQIAAARAMTFTSVVNDSITTSPL